MSRNSGCRGCISFAGAVFGLVAVLISIVEIIEWFFESPGSFWKWAQPAGSAAVNRILTPATAALFSNAIRETIDFAQSSPIYPWLGWLLISFVGGVLNYIVQYVLLLDVVVMEVLILLIPLAAWMWVFSWLVGTVGTILAAASYISFIMLTSLVFGFALERKSESWKA
jgi:hypothetical protein